MSERDMTAFGALDSHEFINLTTYRKSGAAVVTPVWFAKDGDRLYVMTGASAGKVKRIRHTARVEVAPSDRQGAPLGQAQPGYARILAAAEAQRANRLLTNKYGIMKRIFDLVGNLRRAQRAFLEIRPRDDSRASAA